jgi:N-acetylneuraminate synthase
MVKIIAEIGINHNGDINIAKELIMAAKVAQCDYVKIQKRTPELCVPEDQKMKVRQTPWGEMTYINYKKRIEFTMDQIKELNDFAESVGIRFFSSVWDIPSVDDMATLNDIGKIPSALITDLELCEYARKKFKTLIISTGMSTEEEIEKCIQVCNPDVIMHTNSTYPCPPQDLNLRYITHLIQKYPTKEIGYSGHEYCLPTTYAAVVLGATWVERHITLDREMWGSDQKSSVEPAGLFHMTSSIRNISKAIQYPPGPRMQFETENVKKISLRPKPK